MLSPMRYQCDVLKISRLTPQKRSYCLHWMEGGKEDKKEGVLRNYFFHWQAECSLLTEGRFSRHAHTTLQNTAAHYNIRRRCSHRTLQQRYNILQPTATLQQYYYNCRACFHRTLQQRCNILQQHCNNTSTILQQLREILLPPRGSHRQAMITYQSEIP